MQKIVSRYDPHKLSFNEIFANNNGKTSSTKLVGFITSMVCLLLFMSLVVFFFFNPETSKEILEFIDRTITYFSVAAGLMGVKSVTSAFGKQKIQIVQDTSEEIELVTKNEENEENNEVENTKS